MNLSDTIGVVLKSTGENRVLSVTPDQSVYDPIGRMAKHGVGALLVISKHRLVGILSERDYAREGISEGPFLEGNSAEPDHDQPGCVCQPTTQRGRVYGDQDQPPFSPSPGCGGWQPGGSVSIGDLVKWIISGRAQTIQVLEDYITGAYPG